MEKLDQDPYVNHFSHPHRLELSNTQSLHMTSCSACKLQPHGWMYSCKPCSFTLHISCTQMPNSITHPSHPIHPLTLFPAPPYPGGSFRCDVCGLQGTGFSYHCTTCDFYVHMMCPTSPLSLAHQSHPHQLNLAFYPPYQIRSSSRSSSGSRRLAINRQVGGPHGAGNGTLMDTMVQGFVQGAAQQVGETLVQSFLNPDGGGDDSSTPSIISIGSSILRDVFGGN